jgi:hypothetical protein
MRSFATLLLIAALYASAADLNGTYKGTWSGGQASGEIAMTLSTTGGATKADVSFAFGGQDVKCNVTSVKVDGGKIEIVYTFDLGDVKMESTATGELKGKSLEGSYKTKSLADGSAVDEGTWKATSN